VAACSLPEWPTDRQSPTTRRSNHAPSAAASCRRRWATSLAGIVLPPVANEPVGRWFRGRISAKTAGATLAGEASRDRQGGYAKIARARESARLGVQKSLPQVALAAALHSSIVSAQTRGSALPSVAARPPGKIAPQTARDAAIVTFSARVVKSIAPESAVQSRRSRNSSARVSSAASHSAQAPAETPESSVPGTAHSRP
jgi:hypothetical protein